ncbi:hypothetical protein FRB97_006602 [Tulasnella sp. 331]|nr:hypothetical protein FRB97_006602 [Tulasnella sp. 331]
MLLDNLLCFKFCRRRRLQAPASISGGGTLPEALTANKAHPPSQGIELVSVQSISPLQSGAISGEEQATMLLGHVPQVGSERLNSYGETAHRSLMVSNTLDTKFNQHRLEENTTIPPDHVTIYPGSLEQGNSLTIPLQRVFRGPRQVLPDEVASILCSQLSMEELLRKINFHLDTSYDLTLERESLLRTCLVHARDFGTAYSLLRPRWHMAPLDAVKNISASITADEECRREALQGDTIVTAEHPPRRLWDLWSNRVVPMWMVTIKPWTLQMGAGLELVTFFAVSHAWLDEGMRQAVETPINDYEWPVPIPADTRLERIRTELLHHTVSAQGRLELKAQYAWVDVLCLRQKGREEREPVRKEEWRLDVPTIGSTYMLAVSVVYYYSGLGLPFQIGNLQSPRHWVNRAWTLQELKENRFCFIAGISRDSPPIPSSSDGRSIPVDSDVRKFYRRMEALPRNNTSDDIVRVLNGMRHRSATSELDKIAGLNYLIPSVGAEGWPSYVVDEEPEDAWRRFVKLNHRSREELFWLLPQAGAGTSKIPAWYPSWQQVIDATRLPPRLQPIISVSSASLIISPPVPVEFDISDQKYWIHAPTTRCHVSGFAEPDVKHVTREGVVTMQSPQGHTPVFRAVVDHDQPIPDGDYTLLLQPGEIADERVASAEEEGQMIDRRIAGIDANTRVGPKMEHVRMKDDAWWFGPIQEEIYGKDEEEEHDHDGGILYILGVLGHTTLEGAFKKTTTINIKRDRTRFQVLERRLVLV